LRLLVFGSNKTSAAVSDVLRVLSCRSSERGETSNEETIADDRLIGEEKSLTGTRALVLKRSV
jgi:hypothetical protein